MTMKDLAGAPPLVDVQWLAENLGREDIVVLDGTLFLPGEGKSGFMSYLDGHIPGARFFDIDVFSDPDTDLPHMVPSAGRFASLAGALGIENRQHLVIYDAKGLFSAARVWWLFRLFGHDRVSVLDGGLPKWRSAGHPVEQRGGAHWSPTTFAVAFRAALLRGLGDMDENLRTGAQQVLDARPAARFDGRVPEPRQGVRSGHVPASRSLPYTDLLREDKTMLAPDVLRATFQSVGVDASTPVVATCGSGVTAAVLCLAMEVAGLSRGALYDGAWAEWGTCR
ncbi:3-mercaptopyruvate sulfurtransferase [Pandoraea anhela]|nr:3-mercaptopyruvate sulfurtransferase [Pandoraea anhela]